MGDKAQYIVEIKETDAATQPQIERVTSLPIPQSGGLELRNGRTSSGQQTRIINGAAEYSVTQSLIIDATAPRVGNFTIPGYVFEYKGEQLAAPAAMLQVVERGADAGPTTEEMLFLKAEIPETLYVGQTTAVDLKLYIAEGVRLSGLNSFDRSADGFTISELPDNSQEGSEMVNGRRYRVLIWPLKLTPIQTGTQELSFQFGLTAQLPNKQRNRDTFGRSPFGGSIFDDFFGRSERLNIYTDPLGVSVLPLPEENQPENFTGAIGRFAMEVSADTKEAIQGEPIMLSVILKGRGNFDRVEGPAFADSPDWRHYDPEIQFEQGDTLGLRGSQRFDYVFIPQRAGQLELPGTVFSFFDPETEEYVELNAPKIPVQVAPAQNSFVPPSKMPSPQAPQSEVELSRRVTAEEALLTLDYRPKPARPIGTGILTSPGFAAANTLAAVSLVAAALLLRKAKRDREDPSYPARQAAKVELKRERELAETAHRSGDAAAFYKHAQSAIRQAATVKTGKPMPAADSAEIGKFLPEDTARECQELFAAAEAHRFGGQTDANLDATKRQLDNILKAL